VDLEPRRVAGPRLTHKVGTRSDYRPVALRFTPLGAIPRELSANSRAKCSARRYGCPEDASGEVGRLWPVATKAPSLPPLCQGRIPSSRAACPAGRTTGDRSTNIARRATFVCGDVAANFRVGGSRPSLHSLHRYSLPALGMSSARADGRVVRALTDVERMKLWMVLRGDGDSSGQPLPCFTALPPASATSHSANARTCGFPAESGDLMMKCAREPTSVCLNGATSAPNWIRSSTSG
jgi:hypothetical protein